MAKKKPAWQVQQEEEDARIAAQAKRDAEARYEEAKAEQRAYEAAEAARLAALSPEQRAAEAAALLARYEALRQEELRTFHARRRPVIPPAYPIKPVDRFGEPE